MRSEYLLLFVLFATTAHAADLPDCPSATLASTVEARRDPPTRIESSYSANVGSLPIVAVRSQSSQRGLGRRFWLLQALSVSAAIADAESTVAALRSNTRATELNPIFGRRAGRARIYAIQIPFNAAMVGLAYKQKKAHPNERFQSKIVPIARIGMHTALAINNSRIARR